jgi:peptidyl-prolyl cis-trans isomerase B (cyclophilin B)
MATVICLALALAAGCGDDEEESADTGAANSSTAQAETGSEAPAGGHCKQVEQPSPRRDGGVRKPSRKLEAGRNYEVKVRTSCGDFTIALDERAAPGTAASFVSLARSGFFDGTVFHRIVPGFVIQGGDPTGTGTGGPGYKTVDKPPAGARYTKGVVAMAKAGDERPGTAGSQFFVVTGDDAGLAPEYAVLGKVSAGLAVAERIGELGDPTTEQPTQAVVIEGMTVKAS